MHSGFIWRKMPAVLRYMFFLLSGCLSVALTQSQYCPSGTDADKACKGHLEFRQDNLLSGNRRKFTSVFICASPALPCAGVACCQTKFQVPLTAFKMHPHFDEQSCDLSNIGKTGLINKRKTCILELRYFMSKPRYTLNILINLQSIHFCNHQKKIKTLYLNQSLEIKCHPCNNFIDQLI